MERPLVEPFDLDRLPEQVVDRLVTGNSAFARSYYIKSLRSDLSPTSPHPKRPGLTVLSALELQNPPLPEHQPILECCQAQTPKYGGLIASLTLPNLADQFLIPEFFLCHAIPASIFRTTTFLPTLFHKLDDILIARDLNEAIFSSRLKPDLALLAVSCRTSQNLKTTYDRLEFMGDRLLKLISTIDMYFRHLRSPASMKKLHEERHLLVSNRTLTPNAVSAGIAPYILSTQQRPQWMPAGWTWAGTQTEEKERHILGDKVRGFSERMPAALI